MNMNEMGLEQYDDQTRKITFTVDNVPLNEKLLYGVNLLANTVKLTLGAKGKTVMFNDRHDRLNITKDGATVARHVHHEDPYVEMAIKVIREASTNTMQSSGDGPQPLYSKVLTPYGFVQMKYLQPGDEICGTNKSVQKVVDVFPKGNLKIYKLTFSNGRTVECSENHLWSFITKDGVHKTMTVSDIIKLGNLKTYKKNGSVNYTYYTPLTTVDFIETEDFILDPYLTGLLIGDGSLCVSGSIELSLSLEQENILDKLILPDNIKYLVTKDLKKHYLRVKFSRIENTGLTMHDYVEKIGLLNKKSSDKFIPKNYIYSSYENRMKLLQGLIDTDGHVNKRGLIEYSTISEQLANDVCELMRSLGKTVSISLKQRKENGSYSNTPIYVVTELKGYKYGIKLINIEETSEVTEMMCIKVSNDDHLYITDDYIVTHNTTSTVVLAQSIINKYYDLYKSEGASVSYYEFKKNADKALVDVLKEIEKNSLPADQHKDKLKLIATVSANDPEIGDLIDSIISEIGVYGDIEVLTDNSIQSIKVETVKGIRTGKGYYSSVFCNDKAKNIYECENVNIIQYEGTLRNIEMVAPFIELSLKQQRGLIVTVHDIAPICLKQLENAINSSAVQLPIMFVENDGMGDNRIEIMNDIVCLTSASIIQENLDVAGFAKTAQGLEYLESLMGFCEYAKVTDRNMSLINGRVDQDILDEQIVYVKNILDKTDISSYQKKFNRKRLGYLSGGMAIIRVGGQTNLEMVELKDRVDDAVLAVKSAVRSGICIGGGFTWMAIYRALQAKPEYQSNKYYRIVIDSLPSILKQLLYNAEVSYDYDKITEKMKKGYAYDLITNDFAKTQDYKIYDAASVIEDAITNAVTVSKSVTSVNAAIFDGYVKTN